MNRTEAEKAAREITELIDGWESNEPQMADIIERAGGRDASLQMCGICHQPVICCPHVPDPEAAHLQTIDERDHFEDVITNCAIAAGCTEEWSSNHEHGDCIINELHRLRPCGETAWVSAAEFADKYGYDLTRLSHLSGRILDFAEAYAKHVGGETAWVSAADKLLTYIEAHDWGTIPEPWDSVTPLYELMYTRCPKCQNLDRRGDRTKRDHARMPGFICDDSWHDVNSARAPLTPNSGGVKVK